MWKGLLVAYTKTYAVVLAFAIAFSFFYRLDDASIIVWSMIVTAFMLVLATIVFFILRFLKSILVAFVRGMRGTY